jgi:hypothetical protein
LEANVTNPNEVQSNGRTVKENGLRLLAVMYAMSDGQPGVPLRNEDLMVECARVGVFKMTDEEFESYRRATIAKAHALDAEVIG